MPDPTLSQSVSRTWQVERDRFGVMFSGPLEVGEMIEVMPVAEHFEEVANLTARLRGAEQACAEILTTCEGLLGDRDRARESDAWRIRCGDAEAELAKAREITDEVRRAARAVIDEWDRSMILTGGERARFAALEAALGENQ